LAFVYFFARASGRVVIPYPFIGKIDVLDSETDTFHKAEAASIEQLSHEKIGALEKGKEVMDLFASQDNRQSSLLPCSDSISQIAQVFLQDIPEKIQ
jgi:hypothetical protein